ncbi:alpha-amylase-like [Ruditapes philippinarum]|uniref:alpha-amylase-like n=1 Tax=Ruditapes philippinarum TaxID=129788 RepID=UPI00295A7830|nr:alpha-amylase-like [Ruditapes philippinarum]
MRFIFASVFFTVIVPQALVAGPYSDPHCASGRDSIVHLFEWKWSDIKAECQRFLGPYGYCGVQVSPPNENAVVTNPNRPWWERYQPVSYKIISRSGNEQEFRDMVTTCNKAGVRIYVDTVINHMTGSYSGTGTAGDHFDGGSCSFPGVPFGSQDCNGGDNCHTSDGSIHNYNNPEEVRNCRLVGLADLRLSKDYVRGKIAGYLNHLVGMGVAGFRVDAAKHMWPGDLENIFSRLHNLRSDAFGSGKKPFVFQEVIDQGGEPIKMSEYFNTGRVTNFIYGVKLADVFLRHSNQAKWLGNFGEGWGMPSTYDVVVFLSNHDNQRGHGGGGAPITFWDPKPMKIATAFMLAHPYGFPRIMSSYRWNRNLQGGDDKNNWQGPPHNGDMSTQSVGINSDMTCAGDWVCEHRWREVYNMVAFRNVVAGTSLKNFHSYGDQAISFSRGDKGFIALVGDGSSINSNINTGLPSGSYCDVISGNYDNGSCTGKTIHVDGTGNAHINVNGHTDDPMVAIHVGAKVGSPKKVTT